MTEWKLTKQEKLEEQLATCYAELDTLEVTLEAFKQGFINKEEVKSLTSINPKVSVLQKREALLQHAHKSLEKRLHNFFEHTSELEIEAKIEQALREGLIEKRVFDHFASLHSEVPNSMKYRYLLQSVRQFLERKLKHFKDQVLNIKPSQFTYTKDPFGEAKDAVKDGLIEKDVIDYLVSLCPSVVITRQMFAHFVEDKRLNLANDNLSLAVPSNTTTSIEIPPGQLSILYELLVDYVYKWENIGIALNFRPQDLKNIQASLSSFDAPKSLHRLLEDWLVRKHKHTLPPSVDSLKNALKSRTVGLGSLANEIAEKLNSISQAQLNQSYCSISVESSFPKHRSVYLKEGESTLLEIQATLPPENKTYKWQKDGTELSSTEPILCLHQADIDWDGCVFFCQVKPVGKAAPPIITVNVSCILDQFRKFLASIYLAKPEVPEDTWPPVADLKYINLALVKQKKVDYCSEYARFTIRGDMDDIMQDKQIIAYNAKDFFCGLSSGKLILIEGRPGSGKTTFVHKLAQDWAIKSGGAIRLLLLISLRVLNTFSNPDLSDILKLFKSLQVSKDIIEQRSGKGVCFIFDGFDEFLPQDGQASIVHKIIEKTYLSDSIVILASRPAAIAKLYKTYSQYQNRGCWFHEQANS